MHIKYDTVKGNNMIKMIITDGDSNSGLVAINWADKQEHLIPRVNAEYGYRPRDDMSYPFGKNIFNAICSSSIKTITKKEQYCIEKSDITLSFTTDTKRNAFINKILQNSCLLLGKPLIVIDINNYDFCDIGSIVNLIDATNYKIINITGKIVLNNQEKQLIFEFLTIMYNMLKKEKHDYTQYIAYNRD